ADSGAGVLGGEALGGAGASSLRLDLTVARRRIRDERVEQALRRRRDLFDRVREGMLVRLRGLREATHLAHVLLRGKTHLVRSRFGLEVVEGVDVPAHAPMNTMTRAEREFRPSSWTVRYFTPSSASSSRTSASSSSPSRCRPARGCRSLRCRSCSRHCTNGLDVRL